MMSSYIDAVLFAEAKRSRAFVNFTLGFVACAHRRQKRKYTGEPYTRHLIRVAGLVRFLGDQEIEIAALLHDILEDTDVSLEELQSVFGDRVVKLVVELTDVSQSWMGNRAKRKAIDCAHLANSSVAGATIKLADLIDNTESIIAHDLDFARVYLPEKAAILAVLKHGHPELYGQATTVLNDAMEKLKGGS